MSRCCHHKLPVSFPVLLFARQKGATPAQVALAWFKGRPGLAAPIASATTLDQLADLARAAALTLDAEAVAMLDGASA